MSVSEARPSTSENDAGKVRRLDLSRQLCLLVDFLARIGCNGDSEGDSSRGSLGSWGDAEYIYLETELPASLDAEVDISVHSHRVFLRIARGSTETEQMHAIPTQRRRSEVKIGSHGKAPSGH